MNRVLHVCLRWGCCGLILLLMGAALATGGGCASAKTQPDFGDPTTRALSDPMSYKPNFDSKDDINGGGISDFNSKAFNKDVDHVLNP